MVNSFNESSLRELAKSERTLQELMLYAVVTCQVGFQLEKCTGTRCIVSIPQMSRTLQYKHLSFIGGHVMKCAKELKAEGKIHHEVRWGADWNNQGRLSPVLGLTEYARFDMILLSSI